MGEGKARIRKKAGEGGGRKDKEKKAEKCSLGSAGQGKQERLYQVLFCGFPVPKPASTLANAAQNSTPVNTGRVSTEIPAASKLQTVSKHKHGNSKEKQSTLLCSRSVSWARDGGRKGSPGARSRCSVPCGRHSPQQLPRRGEEFGRSKRMGAWLRELPSPQPDRAQTDSQAPAALQGSVRAPSFIHC